MTEQTTEQPAVEDDFDDDEPCGENMCQCGCDQHHACRCGCPRCGDCQQTEDYCDC